VLRGALLLLTSGFSFVGLLYVPVAEVTAIYMLTPLLVTLLAALLLHEPVSRWRLALIAGGFVGALFVIRPGSGLFGWAVLLPLAGMTTYAVFQLLTRRLAGLEDPLTTHFWTGFVGCAVLLPALLGSGIDVAAVVRQATAQQLLLLLMIGALGTLGHLMLVLALGLGPTARLMPFVYGQIGFAALAGWWVFDRVPDGWGWFGMALIAGCGSTGAWLNTRGGMRPAAAMAAD
jgi:drug/metabolite transporter (DMT)-like permease